MPVNPALKCRLNIVRQHKFVEVGYDFLRIIYVGTKSEVGGRLVGGGRKESLQNHLMHLFSPNIRRFSF